MHCARLLCPFLLLSQTVDFFVVGRSRPFRSLVPQLSETFSHEVQVVMKWRPRLSYMLTDTCERCDTMAISVQNLRLSLRMCIIVYSNPTNKTSCTVGKVWLHDSKSVGNEPCITRKWAYYKLKLWALTDRASFFSEILMSTLQSGMLSLHKTLRREQTWQFKRKVVNNKLI